MFNLDIFTTLAYLSPNILRAQGKLRNLSNMYDGLFSGIFKTQGIFWTLSIIYDGKFYSQPCVTQAYLEPCHIQNPRHIQNTAKHLSRNILFKTLCNPDIFRNLVYSELWYILKWKHIQNSTKYLRWRILLRTLYNYSRFRVPYIFKTSAYSESVCELLLNVSAMF